MIDKNFALPGFEAIESITCHGCAFEGCAIEVCDSLSETFGCHEDGRPDGKGVIFVVRGGHTPATANFPCDDMGTPV